MKPKEDAGPSDVVSSIAKSIEGLSVDNQVKKLMKRLADAEELNTKLKARTATLERVQRANVQLEKKLEKANQINLRTEEAKSKLEELCRELQKYNKEIREQSLGKVKILENERQATVNHLKGTLKDIETSMNEGKERSDSLVAENRRLAEKLGQLGEEYEQRLNDISKQYEAKDQYWEEFGKSKDIEIKLYQAKLEAANCNMERSLMEKDELKRSLLEGTARVGGAIESEKHLRAEVKQYASRYEELTKSLSASNTAFDKFKKEIDKVNSNLKKMENDALKWRQKYDEASKNVLVLTMAKKELEDRDAQSAKKLAKLEQLCRALSGRKEQTQAPSTTDEAS